MKVQLGHNGRIILPQEVLNALHVSDGDDVVIEACEGGLKLVRSEQASSPVPDEAGNNLQHIMPMKTAIAKKNLQTAMQYIKLSLIHI